MPDFSLKYLFLCLATLMLAVPLYYKMVPPNFLVGYREQRILDNRAAWYDTNKFFGLQIMKGSLLFAFLSLITPLFAYTFFLHHEATVIGALILTAAFAVYTTKRHLDEYLSARDDRD